MNSYPERLRQQAINVESSGWITAARIMREAAAEIEFLESEVNSLNEELFGEDL